MTPASREAMMGVFCPWALLNFQDSQPRMRKWRLREMKPEPKGTLTCGDNIKSVAMLSKWWVVQSQMAFKTAMLERTFKISVKSNRMATPLPTK